MIMYVEQILCIKTTQTTWLVKKEQNPIDKILGKILNVNIWKY
jgi:hypothetical protein